MTSHRLSGLTGTEENGQRAGDNPLKEGFTPSLSGPTDHVALLEFYFGNPTSTHKNSGDIPTSKW